MERRLLIAGNWKMNLDLYDSYKLAEAVAEGTKSFDNIDVLISPAFMSLGVVGQRLKDSNLLIAAQNCHFEDSGAYTGEISLDMIRSAGVHWVIIGHSERRALFGETDEMVAKKLMHALSNGFHVIGCVGESLEQRENGEQEEVVKRQVDAFLHKLSEENELKNLVIAYEPVWAIGTGKNATPGQAEEMHEFIRNIVSENAGEEVGKSILILYGGSVSLQNAEELLSQPDIDGVLIGGASLKQESFIGIAAIAEDISKE
ncbi:MAG: triose-phosphate isomerase [Candidatus Marinimicrobia bacterium]|nr:triose-phosphate isomerase [Candidatus Neomarinimicrobiota bacterium]